MTNSYSFKEMFESSFSISDKDIKISKIVIPIIQRDYAQGRKDPEINRVRQRFLGALYDAITLKPITLDFVYGDIDDEGVLTPLDGQQRLTTLFLLYWYAAKKENIDIEDYNFLNKFSYRTRYSARDFCEKLVSFKPMFTKKTLSEEITNQFWFPWEWKKDPTINSMLVMLDDIRNKFSDIDDIWNKLDSSIQFYFLPIHDMGLTDELYIKMNSRGKPLTLFENFKAELEYELKENDKIDCSLINNKIDKEWTELLWQFKDEYNSIDNSFLHYFRFICDVICYKNGDSPLGKDLDEIELIKEYFSSKDENLERNINLLISYYDCWNNISKKTGVNNFFNKFVSYDHDNEKIVIDRRYNINIFEDILKSYGEMVGNTNRRQFPLPRFILFYAFLTYCINIDKIEEKNFKRRIRIINNLINNSEYEISGSSTRVGGNRIPAILKQVDSIIINGVIDDTVDINFNLKQLNEEKEKLIWTTQNPLLEDKLFELEDHKLLYGQISVVGLENYNLFSRFSNLFECSYGKIGMALLTIDNYALNENSWRYQLGSIEPSSFINLFHSSSKRFPILKEVLCKLLAMTDNFDDNYLDKLVDNYIKECEEKSLYDFRYYYLKYSEFRPDRFGKYCFNDIDNKQYELDVIWSQSNLSENAYNPFLKAIDINNKLSRADFGRKIIDKDKYITADNFGFVIYSFENDEIIEKVLVEQNENGIDIENRIEKTKNILMQ